MDPFSVHFERGFLRLRWRRGVEITHAHGVAAARALAEFHGPAAFPLLVHMHGVTGVTPEARVGMAAYRGYSRVALVGQDAMDEVLSGFSHRSPTPTRFFTSESEALAWLLEGIASEHGAAPAPSTG
ncbi:STAS/SEC14 domain-containing protein [Arthrobacter sp. NamB2]|uniref:STAS/SEC14 domain-containing protein n=1 Tax=Arthrobacter sp. NamB2 TaxID=2576035 RepID=UPI00167A5F8D|nr:STAS/SEC14 domain-containing protein [Arthrobacter sp. NamB2]